MSKKKGYDFKDIIDSSYVPADYSYGNDYYDKVRESDNFRINITDQQQQQKTQFQSQTQSISRFGSNNNDTFKSDNRSSSNNIFLKNSQNSFSNMNTNKESIEQKKIEVNDDNFPSLGSKNMQPSKIIKNNNTENKLDFKKIVEKKVEIINKQDPKVNNIKPNRFKYGNDMLYYGIKEKSEKIAQMKMVNDGLYSDDNNEDDEYY